MEWVKTQKEAGIRMKKKPLSELEAFVLGLIWQGGPCSPYDIRRQMQRSPSTQWSASAGAIYPLVGKLERHKLVQRKADPADQRRRQLYRVTAAGRKALAEWLGPPLAPEAVTVTYDPLRTRVRFLAALPAAKRRAWVLAAAEALQEVERRVRAWQEHDATDEAFAQFLTRNAELELGARRQWIAEVGEFVAGKPAKRPGSGARRPVRRP